MKRLCDIPIRFKLAATIAATTMAALMLISAAFIAFDYYNSRRLALDELHGIGQMIAENSAAAVAFNDNKTAADVLNTLKRESEIQTACTFDALGTPLAEFHRASDAQCPHGMPLTETVAFAGGGAICRQPILLHDKPSGSIYLESDLSKMRDRRVRFIGISAMFLLGSLAMATLVGAILNARITAPIIELAQAMEEVSGFRNYSVRVTRRGTDEIGSLSAGFNHMLTEIEDNQKRLDSLASTDELTGLPNRRLLRDRLTQLLAIATRQKGQVAVIYLDLDGFKLVNDTLGHSAGDLLLRQVAVRLQGKVRAADTLARIGGDEFTVVLGHVRERSDADHVARELLAQLSTAFRINGHELTLSASMGISLFPEDAKNAEELVQHADTAMYVAKNSGKNCYKWFSSEFGDVVRERLELENQLRGAIERGELALHYQPEFELISESLVRFEALLRWHHPTLGMIPPLKFIPIAEENGLIIPIGTWVMETACTEAVRWQEVSGTPVQVAVNVSNVQFFRDDFIAVVAGVLARTGLNPKLLQLELTESIFIPGGDASADKISQLRALGISMAMDDFGTGYSNLSYLPRLLFDCLKIDRSLLSQICHVRDSHALMQAVINLAHDLNRRVIAEGVETVEQLSLLQQCGCDEVQGYLMGRPTANPDQYMSAESLSWPAAINMAPPVDFRLDAAGG